MNMLHALAYYACIRVPKRLAYVHSCAKEQQAAAHMYMFNMLVCTLHANIVFDVYIFTFSSETNKCWGLCIETDYHTMT
jgi:hypothetical protein